MILCVVFFMSEILIPPLMTHIFVASLQESLGGVEDLQVQIETFPAFLLLLGQVHQLNLQGKQVEIAGLTINSWEGGYGPLHLPPIWGWRGGNWSLEGENHSLTVEVKEEDLNRYLAYSFPELLQMDVSLLEEGVLLSTQMEVSRYVLQLRITGEFQVEGPRHIVFVPQDLTIDEFVLPPAMKDFILEELEFHLDLEPIPLPLHVTQVETQNGVLFFLGRDRE